MLLVDEGPLQREVDEAGDDVVRPDRDLAQHQRNPGSRLQDLQRFADAFVGLVDLVQEQEARDVQLLELAQHQLQLRDLSLIGFADHDRGIDARQRHTHVVDELDRAGTIDEGVDVAEKNGRGNGELDAHAVMAGFGAAVAHRGSRLHRALALDGSGAGQHCFEQRGLAALERAHQCDAPGAPWTRASVLSHTHLPDRVFLARTRMQRSARRGPKATVPAVAEMPIGNARTAPGIWLRSVRAADRAATGRSATRRRRRRPRD